MMPTTTIEDWGDAIFLGISNALNTFLAAIPQVVGALLIILIGWIISSILARLVTAGLKRTSVDRVFADHAGPVYGKQTRQYEPSIVAGEVVKWIIRLVFLVAAANVLGMPQVSQLLNQVLLWIPNLIVAAIILLVAPLLGRFVRGLIEVGAGEMGFTNASLLGRLAEIAIVAFAVIIAIDQIGIAPNLVNTLFIGVVGALALAFGLAFGLGGREVAAELTQSWYAASKAAAAQARGEAETPTERREAEARRQTETTATNRPEAEPSS
jgi:mechanosensitive ion channel-like protein